MLSVWRVLKVDSLKSKFLFLLIALLLVIFAYPYVSEHQLGHWSLVFSYVLILGAVVFSMIEERRAFYFACGFAIIILLLQLLYILFPTRPLNIMFDIASILFYLFAIFLIFFEALKGRKITQDTIYSALSVYLLIGLMFGNIYQLIELLEPNSIVYNSAIYPQMAVKAFDLTYFSFTTLTTVGFGDIVPVTSHAKSIVMLEQISGVLYLAALVSRLVAGMSWESKKRHHHD